MAIRSDVRIYTYIRTYIHTYIHRNRSHTTHYVGIPQAGPNYHSKVTNPMEPDQKPCSCGHGAPPACKGAIQLIMWGFLRLALITTLRSLIQWSQTRNPAPVAMGHHLHAKGTHLTVSSKASTLCQIMKNIAGTKPCSSIGTSAA